MDYSVSLRDWARAACSYGLWKLTRTVWSKGKRSRNKASVGEPADGSLRFDKTKPKPNSRPTPYTYSAPRARVCVDAYVLRRVRVALRARCGYVALVLSTLRCSLYSNTNHAV